MVRKQSMGRQKIEIKRIECEDSRQVTFSKRRAGVFKKANELGILCGAEPAIIIFSPAGKAFSYGHPCVEYIIDRYLTGKSPPSPEDTGLRLLDPHRGTNSRDTNRQYTEVANQFEVEKKKGQAFEKLKKESRDQHWWEGQTDDMSLDELQQLKMVMEELQKNIATRGDALLIEAASQPPFMAKRSVVDPFPAKTTTQTSTSVVHHGYDFGFSLGFGFGRSGGGFY